MKKFEMPIMGVEKLDVANVITTSNPTCVDDCTGYNGDNDAGEF